MNKFWPGIFLLVAGIFTFYVVIFRPGSLKSVRRSGSKYHVSPLGATSCAVAFFAMGLAAILNGLNKLSGPYLQLILVMALAQMFAVGIYDTYRKWKLGVKSPFYVGKGKKHHDLA